MRKQYLSAEAAAAKKFEVPKSANWCAGCFDTRRLGGALCAACCRSRLFALRPPASCLRPLRAAAHRRARLGGGNRRPSSSPGDGGGGGLVTVSLDDAVLAAPASAPLPQLLLAAAQQPAMVWAVTLIYVWLLLLPLRAPFS